MFSLGTPTYSGPGIFSKKLCYLLCYLKSLGLKKLLNAEHSCNIGGEFPWVMTMARNRNLAEGETTLSSH